MVAPRHVELVRDLDRARKVERRYFFLFFLSGSGSARRLLRDDMNIEVVGVWSVWWGWGERGDQAARELEVGEVVERASVLPCEPSPPPPPPESDTAAADMVIVVCSGKDFLQSTYVR